VRYSAKNCWLETELTYHIVLYSAVLKDAVEKKHPITRAMIDTKIDEVNTALESAVEKKAFHECDSLQAKLDELIRQQQDLPTVDELREQVRLAEGAVADAAKNKDFSGAAEAQSRLEDYRKRLENVLAAEAGDGSESEEAGNVLGFDSRAQLEIAIKEMSKEVKSAIASKDFAKASVLQQSLDEREGLRKYFPTAEELQVQLDKSKKELETALSKKDFVTAGAIHKKIAELETKLSVEKEKLKEFQLDDSDSGSLSLKTLDGDEMHFKARGELEAAIAATSKKLSAAVKNKKFKRAEDLQKDIDKMTKMREILPSIADFESKAKKLKLELNKMIAGKNFARADEINAEIESLEAKIKKEKELAPGSKDVRSIKTAPVFAAVPAPSIRSTYTTPSKRNVDARPIAVQTAGASKTVKSLRPAKPISKESSSTVLAVAQEMAARRGHASILTNPDGSLAGILTDKDVVRRVVAKSLDPSTTIVDEVMTKNPNVVGISGS
jgi:CBS domain-containing protein